MTDSPIPQSVLRASGVVGAWTHDHWAGRLALSGSLAGLMGLDPAEAAEGVPMHAFLDRVHPDDRGRIESHLHAAAITRSPVEAEFRTRGAQAAGRTLLIRGRVEYDEAGQIIQGCGIAIDRTEDQPAGSMQSEQIVNRMAEQVIALRGLAKNLHRPALVERIDCLMIEIGFELARFLPRPAEEEARH
jgi:hypothetical protein